MVPLMQFSILIGFFLGIFLLIGFNRIWLYSKRAARNSKEAVEHLNAIRGLLMSLDQKTPNDSRYLREATPSIR